MDVTQQSQSLGVLQRLTRRGRMDGHMDDQFYKLSLDSGVMTNKYGIARSKEVQRLLKSAPNVCATTTSLSASRLVLLSGQISVSCLLPW